MADLMWPRGFWQAANRVLGMGSLFVVYESTGRDRTLQIAAYPAHLRSVCARKGMHLPSPFLEQGRQVVPKMMFRNCFQRDRR